MHPITLLRMNIGLNSLNVWIADDIWNVWIFDDGIIMSNVLLLDSFWSLRVFYLSTHSSNLSLNCIFRQDQTTIRIQDKGLSWVSLMWEEIMKLMATFPCVSIELKRIFLTCIANSIWLRMFRSCFNFLEEEILLNHNHIMYEYSFLTCFYL